MGSNKNNVQINSYQFKFIHHHHRTTFSTSNMLSLRSTSRIAARSLRSKTTSKKCIVQKQQQRNAQTVPNYGTIEEMKADAIAQIRARVEKQEAIVAATSHPVEEEIDEMWKWMKVGFFIAAPVCILAVCKDILQHHDHHAAEGPQPDYMKIRSKAFPWECDDCSLFDRECHRLCKAAKRAAE